MNNAIRCEAIEQRTDVGPHELVKGYGKSDLFSFVFSFLNYSGKKWVNKLTYGTESFFVGLSISLLTGV